MDPNRGTDTNHLNQQIPIVPNTHLNEPSRCTSRPDMSHGALLLLALQLSPPVVNLDHDFILNHDESGESGKRHTLGSGIAALGPSVYLITYKVPNFPDMGFVANGESPLWARRWIHVYCVTSGDNLDVSHSRQLSSAFTTRETSGRMRAGEGIIDANCLHRNRTPGVIYNWGTAPDEHISNQDTSFVREPTRHARDRLHSQS